jgi:hypothetical protein
MGFPGSDTSVGASDKPKEGSALTIGKVIASAQAIPFPL